MVKGRIGKINLYEGIAASELFRLLEGETNWDFVGIAALYRYFHNVYRVSAQNFECFPQDKKFPAPLMEVFPAGREMDRAKFMKDVKRWEGELMKGATICSYDMGLNDGGNQFGTKEGVVYEVGGRKFFP